MTKFSKQVRIQNLFGDTKEDEIRERIISGLLAYPQKHIDSMFFYDAYGSELYEEITKLAEYYPTRTEISILNKLSNYFSAFRDIDIVELGSGDCSKISIILESIPNAFRKTMRYIPCDISSSSIEKASGVIAKRFPEIQFQGIVADFETQLDIIPKNGKGIFCFFGSTIGNLLEDDSRKLLLKFSRAMRPGDIFFVGFDMVKDKDILERAYNDKEGITAKFNLNIVNVVNKHLETDLRATDFEHLAFYNTECSRIEMHIRAKKDLDITSRHLDGNVQMAKGETIHTENSQKFTRASIERLAWRSHLRIQNIHTDEKNWFSLVELMKR